MLKTLKRKFILINMALVFAVMTDGVKPEKTLKARLQLDRFAAALGACRCASSP